MKHLVTCISLLLQCISLHATVRTQRTAQSTEHSGSLTANMVPAISQNRSVQTASPKLSESSAAASPAGSSLAFTDLRRLGFSAPLSYASSCG
jgi:hypothetical protein